MRTDSYGDTPLTFAVKRGHMDCVSAAAANVAPMEWEGPYAHYAAEAGHKETLQALLDAGCGVNGTDGQDRNSARLRGTNVVTQTVCDCCCNVARISPKTTEDGWTLAHSAALQGDKEVLQTLLDAGLDVEGE